MFRFLLCLAPALAAAEAISLPIDAIPRRVATHHPGLRAARTAIEEAKARASGAGRLANPRASLDWRPQNNLNPAAAVFSLEQSFPITRRLALEKKLGSQQIAAATLEVRDAERRFTAEARSLAIQILALSARKELAAEQASLRRSLASSATRRAASGESPATDATQAELDAARSDLEAARLDGELTVQHERLKPQLGIAPADSLILAGSLPEPAAPSRTPAWQGRPDYQLALARLDAAATAADLARARRWDDWSAGLTGGPEYQRTNGSTQTTGFAGLRLSVPLPLWNRNEGEIAAARAYASRSSAELLALGSQIAAEAEASRREMESLASLASRIRLSLLPAAAAQNSQLEKAWQQGEAPFTTLLRAREQQLALRHAGLDVLRDFHLARIRFESATAQPRP
jgi:cobalt-zinc-cadmium efflux system outer membrane protein